MKMVKSKKFFSMLIMAAILLSFASSAFAETTWTDSMYLVPPYDNQLRCWGSVSVTRGSIWNPWSNDTADANTQSAITRDDLPPYTVDETRYVRAVICYNSGGSTVTSYSQLNESSAGGAYASISCPTNSGIWGEGEYKVTCEYGTREGTSKEYF